MQTSTESSLPLNVVALEYPPFSYKDSNGNYDGMEVWLKNSHFKTRTQYVHKESNKNVDIIPITVSQNLKSRINESQRSNHI